LAKHTPAPLKRRRIFSGNAFRPGKVCPATAINAATAVQELPNCRASDPLLKFIPIVFNDLGANEKLAHELLT